MTASRWLSLQRQALQRKKGRTVATKLLAISGPLRKSEFPLGPEVTMGRDAGNDILIEDPAVSPHHCRIGLQDGRFILSDLDSHLGTFVNGIPVKQRELKPGDEIAIGDSVFVLEVLEPTSAESSPVQLCERETLDVKALEFQSNELSSLDPDSLAALPQPARMARNLNALLQICRAIGSLRDEESLPWVLLGMIFDVIPAERGAILLLEGDSHEIRSQVTWDRISGPDHPVDIEREIVRRVFEERISLLDHGVAGQRFSDSPERDQKDKKEDRKSQRALLCVPMICKDRPIGLIYLESRNPTTVFSENDFQL